MLKIINFLILRKGNFFFNQPKIILKFSSSISQQSSIAAQILSEKINKEKKQIKSDDVKPNENNFEEIEKLLKVKFPKTQVFVSDRESEVDETTKQSKTFELFGTPDPSQPISKVPCHGCGAKLHCKDPGLPGYLPSQIFLTTPSSELNKISCQRCHLLKTKQISFDVTMTTEDYSLVIKEIKKHSALILLVVDLTDLSNSFHGNFKHLISPKRPFIIVGNKVDLIPKDGPGFLKRLTESLKEESKKNGFGKEEANVLHFQLLSGKTGYGVEELISTLLILWKLKGHVFVVGCTNSGKSTLFNSLLSSDFCRSSAKQVINRATVSLWPATTQNLLKFPILNPKPSRLYERKQRLKKLYKEMPRFEEARLKLFLNKNKPHLYSRISSTFLNSSQMALVAQGNKTTGFGAPSYEMEVGENQIKEYCGMDGMVEFDNVKPLPYSDSTFKFWCYDTPGLINNEQIVHLLTPEEQVTCLGKTGKRLKISHFLLKEGEVLVVGGLAWVQYLKGEHPVHFSLFTPSSTLPTHVIKGEEVEEFLKINKGSEKLGIPLGDEKRISKIPNMVAKEFTIVAMERENSGGDIVLSSLGWVSVSSRSKAPVVVKGSTPSALGLLLRQPSLIRFPLATRGKRIIGTNRYKTIDLPLADDK